MLHLYAVTPLTLDLPAGLAGLDGAPVRAVAARELAGVVSEHEAAGLPPTEERVLGHAAVVEAVAAAGEALPARYGDTFEDEAALRARLDERSSELAAALEAVRGCVELGLRIAARDGAGERPPPAATGRAYMEALRRRAAGTEAVHEPLARLAERSTPGRSGGGGLLLSAAYLVRRDRVGGFRREVARLQEEHPELALVCTGPWPPYSFVPGPGA